MNAILEFIRDIGAMLPTVKLKDIVDILLVALLIYAGLHVIRTTATARVAKSVLLIVVVYIIADLFNMYLMSVILGAVLEIGILASTISQMASTSFRSASICRLVLVI